MGDQSIVYVPGVFRTPLWRQPPRTFRRCINGCHQADSLIVQRPDVPPYSRKKEFASSSPSIRKMVADVQICMHPLETRGRHQQPAISMVLAMKLSRATAFLSSRPRVARKTGPFLPPRPCGVASSRPIAVFGFLTAMRSWRGTLGLSLLGAVFEPDYLSQSAMPETWINSGPPSHEIVITAAAARLGETAESHPCQPPELQSQRRPAVACRPLIERFAQARVRQRERKEQRCSPHAERQAFHKAIPLPRGAPPMKGPTAPSRRRKLLDLPGLRRIRNRSIFYNVQPTAASASAPPTSSAVKTNSGIISSQRRRPAKQGGPGVVTHHLSAP